MIYQDALVILISMLHNDAQWIIITRVDADGILLGEGDVNLYYPLGYFGKVKGYYIR